MFNDFEKKVKEALIDALNHGENEIKKSLVETSRGRVYRGRTASRPGDPPNSQTGRLLNSINWTIRGLEGEIGTYRTPYAEYLEEGRGMDARPFIAPAEQKIKDKFYELLNDIQLS